MTSLHRDAAVSNMRLLNIFYGFSPETFVFSASLLDRLLGKVKVSKCRLVEEQVYTAVKNLGMNLHLLR